LKQGTVELTIERIVAGGYGLARTEEGTVLVRGALPGERVTARPARKGAVLRAHAIDILEPHPSRVPIDLPGADLPLTYEAQLSIKADLVREALTRIAKLDLECAPIKASPIELGYRTAAQYAVQDNRLGARAVDSDRIIPIETDPLVCEPIAKAMTLCAARPLQGVDAIHFRASVHEGRVLVALIADSVKPAERLARSLEDAGIAGVVWSEPGPKGRTRATTLSGADRLLDDFGGLLATVSVQSFAQVNPPAAGVMFNEAKELAGVGRTAIELFAGSGVLGLHLAGSFEQVKAVEIAADAVKRGEADARRLGVKNLTFHRGDARTIRKLGAADLIAADPPRAGVAPEVLDAMEAPRILMISCDPSTWARDVARLAARGYRLTFARPYDFTPYTHHVEILSVLER